MSQRTVAIGCTMLVSVVTLISCAGHFHFRMYDHGWANRKMDGYKVNLECSVGSLTRTEFDAHDTNRVYTCALEILMLRDQDSTSFRKQIDSLFLVDSVRIVPDTGIDPFTLTVTKERSARYRGWAFDFGSTPVIPASVDSIEALLYFRRVATGGDTLSLIGHFRLGYREMHIPL